LITGILLAAGAGTRFGGGKLMRTLPSGLPISVAALRNLSEALGHVVAVVRPGDDALSLALSAEPAVEVVTCARAAEGMGHSLACAVTASAGSDGWIVALGDMPFVRPLTIVKVADAIREGAPFAAPRYRDRRGHPVGIHGRFEQALLQLTGDQGARSLMQAHESEIVLIDCDDAGVLLDIDTQQDFDAIARGPTAE
jgi:molybdenum cofactor cytidylyltransferase